MLVDDDRTGSFIPNNSGGAAENVVGSGSDGNTYWNLFNIEGESAQSSVYITYDTLADMLVDDDRTGSFIPNNSGGAAENVVGSGSDGNTYWNLFNIEGESSLSSVYITYASLLDMLNDDDRTGSFIPDNSGGAAENVVGSGAWVSITAPPNDVPEPTTFILLVMGLLCMGYGRNGTYLRQIAGISSSRRRPGSRLLNGGGIPGFRPAPE
jgi:hypothetical protein